MQSGMYNLTSHNIAHIELKKNRSKNVVPFRELSAHQLSQRSASLHDTIIQGQVYNLNLCYL